MQFEIELFTGNGLILMLPGCPAVQNVNIGNFHRKLDTKLVTCPGIE